MTERPGLSLPDWYPLIEPIVPTPRTRWVREVGDLSPLLDGLQPAGWASLLERLGGFGAELGYPLFLRSGLTSGKHDWARTCLVSDQTVLGTHVAAIVEFSAMADLFGLDTDDWVVRELLPTKPAFYAFGGMPITRERRYFVADGHVYGHTPYWPPESIEAADNPHWPALLEKLNHESAAEVRQLTELSELVSRHVPGAWSVDWLHVPKLGWFCIDMAHAEVSYCWTEYPTAPAPDWWDRL